MVPLCTFIGDIFVHRTSLHLSVIAVFPCLPLLPEGGSSPNPLGGDGVGGTHSAWRKVLEWLTGQGRLRFASGVGDGARTGGGWTRGHDGALVKGGHVPRVGKTMPCPLTAPRKGEGPPTGWHLNARVGNRGESFIVGPLSKEPRAVPGMAG